MQYKHASSYAFKHGCPEKMATVVGRCDNLLHEARGAVQCIATVPRPEQRAELHDLRRRANTGPGGEHRQRFQRVPAAGVRCLLHSQVGFACQLRPSAFPHCVSPPRTGNPRS